MIDVIACALVLAVLAAPSPAVAVDESAPEDTPATEPQPAAEGEAASESEAVRRLEAIHRRYRDEGIGVTAAGMAVTGLGGAAIGLAFALPDAADDSDNERGRVLMATGIFGMTAGFAIGLGSGIGAWRTAAIARRAGRAGGDGAVRLAGKSDKFFRHVALGFGGAATLTLTGVFLAVDVAAGIATRSPPHVVAGQVVGLALDAGYGIASLAMGLRGLRVLREHRSQTAMLVVPAVDARTGRTDVLLVGVF